MATGFETVHFDLSMCDPEYGTPLQANAYHVEGIRNVDGSLRDLSIGQLVMAICLQRASELETSIISQMNSMSLVTANLEALTNAQAKFVGKETLNFTFPAGEELYLSWDGGPSVEISDSNALITWLRRSPDGPGLTIANDATVDDVVQAISSKMDSLNSVNQQDLIQLQSLTSKRDQSYDLITNVLKSFNTVMIGNANNL